MAFRLDEKRRVDFLERYLNPESPTYSNAYKSALDAGFAQEYAENITHLAPQWLSEAIGSEDVVSKEEILVGIKQETKGKEAKDRLKAWELLGKYKELFTEKIELTPIQDLPLRITRKILLYSVYL